MEDATVPAARGVPADQVAGSARTGSPQDQRGDPQHDDSGISYRGLFEYHPNPMVVLDADGHVIAANRRAETLLGVSPRDMGFFIAEQFSPRVDASPTEKLSQLLRDVLQRGSVGTQFKLPTTDHVLEAQISCLPDEIQEGTGFLWTAHDVTERVHLEETRQELANMVVHDLRVPLGNIQNTLDLVLTAWRERDVSLPIDQVLLIGQRSAQRMEQLINDILDAARLQANERTLTVTSIDVKALVGEAVEIIIGSAQRRDQTVHVTVSPDLPSMEGDLELLRRVLVNLLANAVKYTHEGDRIVLTAELAGVMGASDADNPEEQFQFTVEDNGPGIAPRVQERLFRLFYRGDSTLAKSAGIGLAFCKVAVEAHGGQIWVESTPGSGSAFIFTIPRSLPRHAPYYQEGN
jgi:PAS domain S-box-containing protein